MTIIFILMGIVLIGSLVITASLSKENKADQREIEKTIIALTQEKLALENEINERKQQLQALQIDKHTELPHVVNSVLDKYERSNIRIPKDILEDITYLGLFDESEIFSYIENQRHHWKLENSKKINVKAGV